MNTTPPLAAHIRAAAVLIPCVDLAATLAFLTESLGFRVETIFPADAPTTAVVVGGGTRLRLIAAPDQPARPFTLYLSCDNAAGALVQDGPNGLRIEWDDITSNAPIPEGTQEFVLTQSAGAWGTGRAGMQYRDLIPSRLGGRFIASHIRIPDGGPVADYVHFHQVRFQMIFCKAGWVKVVYEDQGEPFVLHAGDCVLQPPLIRHRVLEASPGLEVIEIGCPAIHETHADFAMLLPTLTYNAAHDFSGRRFVRHVAAKTPWSRDTVFSSSGCEARDTGIEVATKGLARVRALRWHRHARIDCTHTGELLFLFLLRGSLDLASAAQGNHALQEGDCVVIPAQTSFTFNVPQATDFVELLEVRLPA